MAMGMQGSASLTFARMAMALAGAGVSVWGAQRMCDEKIAALKTVGGGKANPNYAPCTKNVPSKYPGGGAAWKVAGPAQCAAKHPPSAGSGKGSMLNKILFYGGFGIIVASVVIMWLLNSQMFSGMGMGMMGGGGMYGGGF